MTYPIFTLAAGRSGSAWLANFLTANLGFPAVHEPLGIDDFGNTMPDIRTMRAFNTRGMDDVVRGFWQRKLTSLPKDAPYAETNHTLGKCGLIETLAESPLRENATVIVLRRNLAKQCVSYINRNDFGNITLAWQWYLTPGYNNIIVNPSPFLKMGPTGRALWYTLEMDCRQTYYERQYAGQIRFVPAQLETVTKPDGARTLLAALGGDAEPVLPPKANANAAPANASLVDEIETFLKKNSFDSDALVTAFLQRGGSLHLPQQAAA